MTTYYSITLLHALHITVEPSYLHKPITVEPLICTTSNSRTLLYALPMTVDPSYMHYL